MVLGSPLEQKLSPLGKRRRAGVVDGVGERARERDGYFDPA
jgi:hypothetical protein